MAFRMADLARQWPAPDVAGRLPGFAGLIIKATEVRAAMAVRPDKDTMPIHSMRRLAFLLIGICAVLWAGMASAQNVGSYGAGLIGEQQAELDRLTATIDDIAKKVAASAEDDARLVALRTDLETVSQALLKSGLAFRPRLGEINSRLEQLGPAPAEGQPPEPDIVASERQNLVAEKAEINALLGVAENLSVRVKRLIDDIAEMRRDLFARLLTKRYAIDYALVGEVLTAFSDEIGDFYYTVSSWLRFVFQFKLKSVTAAAFFALVAAAVLLIGGRRLLGNLFAADPSNTHPSYLSRLSIAFWSTLLPSAALAVFLAATYFFFDYYSVLRGDIGEMLQSLFYVVAVVYFVHRLGRAILAPRNPDWRLIPVGRSAGQFLVVLVSATAFFTGIDHFLTSVFDVLGSPLSLTVGESLVSTVLTGALIILIGVVKPFVDDKGTARNWHPAFRFLLFGLGGATILAGLLGYIGLARFMSQQIVITGAILATMYIGFLSAGAIAAEGAFGRTALGKGYGRWFKVDETTLDQLGLVVSIAINFIITLIGVPLILLQWGFQPGDISAWLYRLATEITIGSVSFSLTGVLTGIIVFVIGYFLTRWFQGWLDGSVMARGRVDAGVRNSIRTAIGYAGVAFAALLGISAAGIDLSNLALVAGALSLGIGFGLQNVVSNFVSGLILLAERPFKVGDWIVAGPVSGTVKKISVRATEIETFQRQSVILPNSELINAAVGNWTHRNRLGRVEIQVGAAYGSDPRKVHAILLEIARSHPAVLRNPEPFVHFSGFGDTGLTFEVRIFLADITGSLPVQNDIRFAIVEAFEREGIDMPHRELATRMAARQSATTAATEQDETPVTAEPAEPRAGRSRRRKPDPE